MQQDISEALSQEDIDARLDRRRALITAMHRRSSVQEDVERLRAERDRLADDAADRGDRIT